MKLIFRHIITIGTLVCFLTATSGLSIVEHYCSSQGKSFIAWFSSNPDCEEACCGHTPVSCCEHAETACCAHENTSDCCQNTGKFLKLIADYFSTHSDTEIDCPISVVEHSFDIEETLAAASILHVHDFSEDVGLPEQLLIKRTTEFLL